MIESLLLACVAGALLCLSFPDFAFYPLAWIGLVPYLLVLFRRRTWKIVVLAHLAFSAGYFGGVLCWVPRVLVDYGHLGWILGLFAWGILILTLAGLTLPAAWLLQWIGRQSVAAAAMAAPGIWLAAELARDRFPFGGFPWASLGYSQTPFTWLIQAADLGSVYLISAVVVFFNACLTLLILKSRFKPLFASMGLVLVLGLYGFYRVSFWEPAAEAPVKVGLAQGNIELMGTSEHYAEKYFKTLARLYDEAVSEGAAWVIFPEAQNPYRFERDFYFRQFWEDRIRHTGVPLLINSTSSEEGHYFNSAYLLSPETRPGEFAYIYRKNHLVPFGEYLPLSEVFGKAKALVAEVSHFSPGQEMNLGTTAGISFGTLICYEAIFPALAAEAVNRGAEVLVNITNDGWFGDTSAPGQHLQLASVRAIENRRPLLRAANSGYTVLVDAKGRILQSTALFTEDVLLVEVRPSSSVTLFSATGYLPCLGIIMLSAAASGFFGLGGRKARKERNS